VAAGMQFYGLYRAAMSGSHPNLSHIGAQYLHVAIGSLLMSSSIVVDNSMAASWEAATFRFSTTATRS